MRRFLFLITTLFFLNISAEGSQTESSATPPVIEEILTKPLQQTPSQDPPIQHSIPTETKEIEEQNQNFQGAIFKTLASLAGLIALVLFTVWLLRRISQNRHTFGLKSNSIQILEKRLLSPKTTLFLMEVDGKKIVFAESMLEVKVLYKEDTFSPPTPPVPYQ